MAKKSASSDRPGTETWSRDWSVGVRVWVERNGQPVLDESIAGVLDALDRTKSISAAARTLGISYRHAWLLIQQANENSGQPLVATAVGGQRGGGAQLTEHGLAAVSVFQQVRQQVHATATQVLPRIVAPTAGEPVTVHLAAAISLQEVVALLRSEYILARPTVTVRTIFGSSNELADQIAAGGAIDLFLSADGSHINRLAKEQWIERGSRRNLAANNLTVVGDRSLAGRIRKPADLRQVTGKPILIADPACPLGRATAQFLQSNGLWNALKADLHVVENSRAVVSSLRAGRFPLGIIFGSDLANAAGTTVLLQVPETQMKSIYVGAVVATSPRLTESRELLAFFASKQAQSIWRRCGFSVE